MKPKLYKVTATVEYVVSVYDANPEMAAVDCWPDAVDDLMEPDGFTVAEVNSKADLPTGWDEWCYPYNAMRNTPYTIEQIMEMEND